jgi:hypothetical protein
VVDIELPSMAPAPSVVDAEPPSVVDAEPPSALETGPHQRLWLADRVSTPEERQAFRAAFGMRYESAVRLVARSLSEHPGLRGAGMADATLVAELAAVRLFVTGDQAEFVESVRAGGREHDRPFAVCVAGGLRRLPSLQGVVVRGGPEDPGAADAYVPGQELAEEAPMIALDDVSAQVPGAVELLIWSVGARRLSGLADGPRAAEVAFLPGAVFRVLAVDPPPSAPSPDGPARRVLLAELPPGRSKPVSAEWADRILTRLAEAAAARVALPRLAPDPAEHGRFAALPGDPARASVVPMSQRSMP